MSGLFKPDATMLTGLVIGVFVIPWVLARLNK
jgi:hypothetical protein